MSLNPTFAEFVIYYLPVDEQRNGNTLNRDNTLPPCSKNSILDDYHYKLLLRDEVDCDREQLKKAWNEWGELGKYEHGERYRRTLFENTKRLNRHLELFDEIKAGVDGTSRQIGLFWIKWRAKGLREAKSNKDWEMWKEVEAMTRYFPDPVGCEKLKCQHYGECLGKKIYR